jgi:hypothetical protein
MHRALWLLVFCTGCSTAPMADFLDHFFPAKVPDQAGQRTRGGVCDPQTIVPTLEGGRGVPPAAPAAPPSLPADAPMFPGGARELPPTAPPPAIRF